MTGICFDTKGGGADHESLNHGDLHPKGSGGPRTTATQSESDKFEMHDLGVDATDRTVGGRIELPTGDPGGQEGGELEQQAFCLPSNPHMETEEHPLPCLALRCPGVPAEGCNMPAGHDQEQAEGCEGMFQSDAAEVEMDPCRAPWCPGVLAGGCSAPAGCDQEQAAGCEGRHQRGDERDATEPGVPFTGRFHPLMEASDFPEGTGLSDATSSGMLPQACDLDRDVTTFSGLQLRAAFSEREYVLSMQGGGSNSGDAPSRQRGAGVWSSTPSGEKANMGHVHEEWFSLSVATWNLAGAGKKKIKGIVATEFQHDIAAVQEYPRQEVGWHVIDHGRMSAVLHQDVMMYRAVGIMYDKCKFRVRKRKHAAKGVWVLLEYRECGREMWVGSLHLPVNEVVEEVERFTAEFLAALPATDSPALMLGDMNTHFTWRVQQGIAQPRHIHSRWSKLRQATVERGFTQVSPCNEDIQTPTFIPRRAGASSTQIDGIFAARCHVTPAQVEKDSRHEIGTDHERVMAEVLLRGVRTRDDSRHKAGGPRKVVSTPPPQPHIDDKVLSKLATTHTRPASLGPKFRMSAGTRELQRLAKTEKTAQAWKTYLSGLRREKDA